MDRYFIICSRFTTFQFDLLSPDPSLERDSWTQVEMRFVTPQLEIELKKLHAGRKISDVFESLPRATNLLNKHIYESEILNTVLFFPQLLEAIAYSEAKSPKRVAVNEENIDNKIGKIIFGKFNDVLEKRIYPFPLLLDEDTKYAFGIVNVTKLEDYVYTHISVVCPICDTVQFHSQKKGLTVLCEKCGRKFRTR